MSNAALRSNSASSTASPLSAANSGLRRTHRAGLRGVHLEERGLLAADPSARPRPCLAPAPRTARLTPSSRRRRGELLNTEVMPSAGVANDSVGESMELFATTDVDLNGTSISSSTSRTTLTSMNAGGVPRRPHGRASGLTPGPEPRAADGRTRGSSRVAVFSCHPEGGCLEDMGGREAAHEPEIREKLE